MKNEERRKTARSKGKECKPYAASTRERAEAALKRIAEEYPFKAMGMRVYLCTKCRRFHIGRAPTR